jgi:hypothetical protein
MPQHSQDLHELAQRYVRHYIQGIDLGMGPSEFLAETHNGYRNRLDQSEWPLADDILNKFEAEIRALRDHALVALGDKDL